MSEKIGQAVFNWLLGSGIRVSRTFLDEQLQSHPDYPTLACITDTLDELGIDNLSLVTDKERVHELPVPFLAYSDLRAGHFIVIDDVDKQIRQDKKFRDNWDGIVVLLEKPNNWSHAANEKALIQEKAKRRQLISGLVIITLLMAVCMFTSFSLLSAGLWLAALTGSAIAVFIVQEELGISNQISNQLCGTGEQSGCKTIIRSNAGRWMSWADAGIIYFFSFSLLLCASSIGSWLPLLALSPLPFIPFSVFYQWRIAKRWCRLCLLVVGVLAIQFALLFPSLTLDSNLLPLRSLAFLGLVFAAVTVSWILVIKPILKKNKEIYAAYYASVRIKNDPIVFNALLTRQRQVDTTPLINDLQLGNPGASTQIIVACNPYCAPCAKTHEILNDLADSMNIGLTVRFYVKPDFKEDSATQATEHILRVLADGNTAHKKTVLHTWYKDRDLDRFNLQYPSGDNEEARVLMEELAEWSLRSKIAFTPTIFINGYELPSPYKVSSLKNVLTKERSAHQEETDFSKS